MGKLINSAGHTLLEANLLQLLDTITDGVAVLDERWHILYANEQALKYARLEPAELSTASFWDIFPKAVDTIVDREYRASVQDKKPVQFEVHCAPHEQWLSISAFPVAGGLITCFADITALKQLDKASATPPAEWRKLVMQNPDPILVFQDREIVFANPAAVRFVGVASPAELTYASILGRMEARDQEMALARLNEILVGHPQNRYEYRWETRGGAALYVEAASVLVTYNGKPAVQTVFRDVTERKRIELALRQSEARFASVFYAAPIPAVITTLDDDRFVDVNESFEHLTGYTREEVKGLTAEELKIWPSPDDQARLQAAKESEQGFRGMELRLQTKDRQLRSIIVSGETVEVNSERVLIRMFYDITEQKRSEEQLMRAVQEVMQDTTWFSQALMEKLAQVRSEELETSEVADLRPRERQVLAFIAKGMSNQEIALQLGIAEQTVRNYISGIYEKIHVNSRAEAVVWARQRGIIG